MFIELADHLRCPEDHDEQYLVLLPDSVERRWIVSGTMGCPVCGREWRLEAGVWRFGDTPAPPGDLAGLDAAGLAALVGLGGPGGYLAVAGAPGALWRELGELVPGVALVAVNPPAAVADEAGVSVLRGPRLPLKTRSMRGVVLGPGCADEGWVGEAVRVTLPGLRIVGYGPAPAMPRLEVLASAGGWWVARVTN